MKSIILKLRISGIVAFFLFIFSMLVFPPDSTFQFNQVQPILILVSFVIFAILILFQLYEFYLRVNARKEETDP